MTPLPLGGGREEASKQLNMQLAFALAFTIIVELCVLLYLRERRAKVLWASVGINTLTNITLNLYFLCIGGEWISVLLAEILVVIVEGGLYYLFLRNIRQALVYSFFCNAISFLSGLLISLLFTYFSIEF